MAKSDANIKKDLDCGTLVSAAIYEHKANRYLGMCLGGAKSDRTALTVIDYYPKQTKAVVVDIFEGLGPKDNIGGDEVLLQLIDEIAQESSRGTIDLISTTAPLGLPPCFPNCKKNCDSFSSCDRTEVRWMNKKFSEMRIEKPKQKQFTPYTQRPVDLYFKSIHDEVNLLADETLGANQAPHAARMSYLKNRINKKIKLIEVWPKLALFYSQKHFKLNRHFYSEYRNLEEGMELRVQFIEKISQEGQLFIYERDLKKFLENVEAFDSLVCAWVGMLSKLGQTKDFAKELPEGTSLIHVPKF